jgi:serine/threonine-protein kinase
MMHPQDLPGSPEAVSPLGWIDAVADRFEAAWRSGPAPRISDYLHDASGDRRSLLLIELVKIDIDWRRRRGMECPLQKYVDDFPELLGPDGALPADLVRYAEESSSSSPNLGADAGQARPQMVGKYLVLEELGRGGQAVVYRALNPELKHEVVIKLSLLPLPHDPAVGERFLAEGRLLAQLKHPSLVPVHDAGVHEGHCFLVMEYVRGCNLEQYARGRRLTARAAAALVAALARALAVVHRQGIVHQDLKPQNILINERGTPQIIDFGLARVQDVWSAGHQPDGGTASYMAPEQAQGQTERVTARTDLFSLGGVLYYLLVGQAPLAGKNRQETLERAQRGAVDEQALRRARAPRRLRRISLKALAADPGQRYATAEELAADLDRFLRLSIWEAAVGAAIGLLGLAVLFGWMRLRHPDLPAPPTLSIQVWRAAHRIDLVDAMPLGRHDEIKIRAEAPDGAEAALFLVSSEGRLQALPTQQGSSRNELWFPGPQAVSPLQGRPGTEAVLVCIRRGQPVALEAVQDLWNEAESWPPLPVGTVLKLEDDRIEVLQQGRDFGPARSQPDPELTVEERLKRLGAALHDRLSCRVRGLVFAHED